MRRSSFAVAAALFIACASFAPAQSTRASRAITPPSSIPGPTDAGERANTNIEVIMGQFSGAAPQTVGPPFAGFFFETPASLACIYRLVNSAFSPDCNPNSPLPNATAGSRAIAIVDAFDDPNAAADLQTFSTQFGLPPITPSNFQVVFAPHGAFPPGVCTGPATKPPTDPSGGWELEESLDIEYAHGMAPGAKIYLVEAQSNSLLDLFCAVSVANSLVSSAGGGEISMSWGSGEFSVEKLADPIFTTPGVVYFASTGDSAGTSYPASSPNVVAVGGTSVSRDSVTGKFLGENVWQETGGGPSPFEPVPSYQAGIVTRRSTPDVVADANPTSGAWVLDSFNPPPGCQCWYIVGGTSLSSPLWAGIVNASNTFAVSTYAQQLQIYGTDRTNFTDITLGTCGVYVGYMATQGWDFCSGNGSPKGYLRITR